MRPRSIAIVGASQREVRANRVIRNLQRLGFSGDIYPINPRYDEVLGLRCYPDVASTPVPADCAVVSIPARAVPDLVTAVADAGVRSAVILASGFGESGEQGERMQARLEEVSRDRGLLICGPNCFGIFNVSENIPAFIGAIATPLVAGNVGLVSQSGGVTNIIVPPLMEMRGIGFSTIVSCGNQAGVTIEEYVDHLLDDAATEVVAVYVEGFKRPDRLFAIAAKARRLGKPIIVLKVGRSEVARRAALAHTGSLVGAAEAAEAVLRRAGIVQVRSLNEFMETIALLSHDGIRARATPETRVGVLTSTGGLIGYIGDVAADLGVQLPPLADTTAGRLAEVLPDFAGATNPLDGTGAIYDDPEIFPRLLRPLLEDPGIDVAAVNLDFAFVPKEGMDTPRRRFVPAIVELAPSLQKPLIVFTSKAGSGIDPAIAASLRAVGVPLLDGTEEALAAIRNLARHRAFQAADAEPGAGRASDAVVPVDLPSGILDQVESFRLLERFGIPVAQLERARSEDEAVEVAQRLGYPVVLKVDSPVITHKSDVGGVVLDLRSPDAVRDAYRSVMRRPAERTPGVVIDGVVVQRMMAPGQEMLLGVKRDPVFGPIIACGLGGVFVEILGDVAVDVPPLSAAGSMAMIGRLRGRALLEGARGRPPADVEALIRAIVGLGDLALALGDRVEAIDINPLVVYASGEGAMAVDALIQIR
jgi:acetyltransferase